MFGIIGHHPFGRPITRLRLHRLDLLIAMFIACIVFLVLAFTAPAKAAQCNTIFLTDRVGQLSFPFCPPNRSTGAPGLLDNMSIGSQVPGPGVFSSLLNNDTTPIVQGTPATLNATGTLTAAQLATGIITSTSAAAVAATLPLGSAMDTANPNTTPTNAFDFFFINTGPSTVTMTAATGFTIVGTATVLTLVSAHFRAVRTGTATWVLYRLS